jgi:hypothetical protein
MGTKRGKTGPEKEHETEKEGREKTKEKKNMRLGRETRRKQ